MLTEAQAKEVVEGSLEDALGVTRSKLNLSPNTSFADIAAQKSAVNAPQESLHQLLITLASNPSTGVGRFEHYVDVNQLASDLNLRTTVAQLIDLVSKTAVGKLCSNPTDPHEQTCCPYPSTCPKCGFPVR